MSASNAATRIIRKKTGHFLEDFQPGQIFRHKGGKTITEGLFTTFTEFAMTTNPLSKNARHARAHGFDGLVCSPGLVMLVAFSQTVEDVSENARANLEYIDMRFGAPVYVGDTIEVETKVIGVRDLVEPPESRHRPRPVDGPQEPRREGRGDRRDLAAQGPGLQETTNRSRSRASRSSPTTIDCELVIPPYAGKDKLAPLAHLSSRDSYFEDLEPGTRIEHSRGRTVTYEHIAMTAILDNTSQVHCNQFMIDLDPKQYVGGQLIIFGGIPFTLCLGLSCPDVGDNALGDVVYTTGRHTAPLQAGDTVFAATEILARQDHPTRPDLGLVSTRLFGHKFVRLGRRAECRRAGRLEEGARSSSSTAPSRSSAAATMSERV